MNAPFNIFILILIQFLLMVRSTRFVVFPNRDLVTLIVYNCQSSLVDDNNLILQFTLIICNSAPFLTPIEQKQCTIKEISALFSLQLHNFSTKKPATCRSLLFYCTILLAVSIFIWTRNCGSLKFKCIGAEEESKNRDL